MAEAEQVLFSFVGNRDPYVERPARGGPAQPPAEEVDEFGPVLSLLQARRYARVYLFCTGSDYVERARTVEEIARTLGHKGRFHFVDFPLDSPIDYEEIFAKLRDACAQVQEGLGDGGGRISVLLDPGTPQMQTAWFLLVRSGMLEARLLQGTPPRFAGGSYKVREVDLSRTALPEVTPIGRAAAVPEPLSEYMVLAAEEPAPAPRWLALRQGDRIIGQDPAFLAAVDQALRVASYDISVLIRGETGTGKGLIARLIHEQSRRAENPFVSVNCANLGASLAESELFGHLKGAYTGADHDRPGKFRSAQGGTLFLDEIGDLPPEVQPKLLRALEEKLITPVGADRELRVDVRILAATNQDLDRLMAEKRFRRDLFERLNQFVLTLPPLRERAVDIPLLLRAFLEAWNGKYAEDKSFSEEALGWLARYPWPGNLRELRNAVEYACASARSSPIAPQLLPPAIQAHFSGGRTVGEIPMDLPEEGVNLRALLYQVERRFYELALRRAGGNRERAAALLQLNAPAFRKALRERFDDLAGA